MQKPKLILLKLSCMCHEAGNVLTFGLKGIGHFWSLRKNYLGNLLHTRQSLYNLRSTSAVVLNAPRSRTNVGSKAFAATGPKCWKRLPQSVRLANSLSSFKSQLKTHLYPKLL